jgi:LemA protein
MSIPIIILIILALLALWVISTFNGFVRRDNRVKEAWADIEVQLKRRYDLVPNLVETVKGYMTHERTVFENVTQARAAAMGAKTEKERLEAENMFTEALKTLFAVAENYPDLKANQNFLELQRELRDTEDKIQAARRFYNSNVRDYNTAIQMFPNNIVANIFGFKPHVLFDIDEKGPEGQPVRVQF